MARYLVACILALAFISPGHCEPHFVVGPELQRYHSHHRECGVPVGAESWHLGAFSQRFVHCTLFGRVEMTKGTPMAVTPSLTSTVAPPPPPSTPIPTLAPTSTRTAVPSPPTPTDTPTPAPTRVPPIDCPGSGCASTLLTLVNSDRAQYGVAPLTLSFTLSAGEGACVGAQGHSVHMAQIGYISHDQFPGDVCGIWTAAGENVGEAGYGNELTDIRVIDQAMMSEPHDLATCAAESNHACNIINPAFHQIGIGLDESASQTWLTEDFTN
jgi:uncharacterized protein YkwD